MSNKTLVFYSSEKLHPPIFRISYWHVHHNSWLIGCWVWTLEDRYLQPENKCVKLFRKEQNGKKEAW